MGLDTVEIVMEVEDTFGIVFSDEAAPQIRTVGGLHQYILECRRRNEQQGCATARMFRGIRRFLVETGSVPRRAIRPSTHLTSILPPRHRRRVWISLQASVSGRLRGLRLPFRLGPIIAGLCIAAGVVGMAIVAPQVGAANAIALGVTTTVTMLLLVFFVTRPLAVALPNGVVTVGDVAHAALPPGYGVAAKQEMADEEVWQRLQKIVSDILCVKNEEVTPSARFVEDLGAG